MIDLHFVPTPNGHKVSIMLEELGLTYRLVPYDMLAGDHLKPEFRQVNPNGRLPAIVDQEPIDFGEPFAVFESGAILLYLAEKTGKLLPADPAARFDAIQWLMTQMSTVGPMFGQMVHYIRYAPAGNDYSKSRYITQATRVTEVIDHRLAKNAYLAGSAYSVADIATHPWLRIIPALMGAEAMAKFPNVARWVAEIDARPAVQAALVKVAEVRAATTQADKAEAPVLDKLFGRGGYAAG